MNCNICNNEFKYIEGLKFCPYCGSKLNMQFIASEEEVDKTEVEEVEILPEEYKQETVETKAAYVDNVQQFGDEGTSKVKVHDTLEMPVITEDLITDYKRTKRRSGISKFIYKLGRGVTSKVFIIPFFALIVLGLSGFLSYHFLLNSKVEEGHINVDIVGKTLVLPKGTNFEIQKSYIKDISIAGRLYNKEENTEYIDVNAILNNGNIEVKGTLQLAYIKEGKNQWKLMDKIQLKNDVAVKAVSGMEETKLVREIKKRKVSVVGEEVGLEDDIVIGLKVLQRSPNFEEGKEEALIEVLVDGGVLQAKGNFVASLSFFEENWIVSDMKVESDNEFEISLSETLSEEIILEQIKKKEQEEYVTHSSVFGGKSFLISDKYVFSTEIQSKSLDDSKKKLNISLKRNSKAGVLSAALSADYTFKTSLKALVLENNTKSVADEVSVNSLSKDGIAASLSNVEMEGRSDFFWWSYNHKLTESEAKTFKLDEILTKAGYKNINYVYGDLTYNEGNRAKTVSVVAIYYLLYDNSKGYQWKLDSLISSESTKYNYYSKEAVKSQ